MKNHLNILDLNLKFSTSKELEKAFAEIVRRFNLGKLGGSGFGGDYHSFKYSIISALKEAEIQIRGDAEPILDKGDLIEYRIEEIDGVECMIIPSKMNFDKEE